jgi:hypothetical protein
MNKEIKLCELVKSSEYEEFYYSDSDLPVEEGDPVGVDLESGEEVKFILFNGIYWGEENEERVLSKTLRV